MSATQGHLTSNVGWPLFREDEVIRRTFLVNGRGIDVESIDLSPVSQDEDFAGYYEVSGPNIKHTLIYSGPVNVHKKVIEYALAKWYDLGEVDEKMLNFPTENMGEV